MVAGGYRAIDSMRLEKGYRVWGADITPDETPYEGGVGFCVKLDKPGGFIGRDALAAAKEEGPRTRLRASRSPMSARSRSATSPSASAARSGAGHDRRLRLHGRLLDRLRLRPDRAEPGTAVGIEIFGEWIEGEIAAEPLFDPKGERIRTG